MSPASRWGAACQCWTLPATNCLRTSLTHKVQPAIPLSFRFALQPHAKTTKHHHASLTSRPKHRRVTCPRPGRTLVFPRGCLAVLLASGVQEAPNKLQGLILCFKDTKLVGIAQRKPTVSQAAVHQHRRGLAAKHRHLQHRAVPCTWPRRCVFFQRLRLSPARFREVITSTLSATLGWQALRLFPLGLGVFFHLRGHCQDFLRAARHGTAEV
mmetsp:Transcript_53310/g.116343  ORF Transcript_53310/g.116343 Transcript_53310/m.116343 type:complete len:212 (+) Transcript_53310:657-1292(+)